MPSEDETGVVPTVVVLGTGGTIAGSAASATDNVGYRAAELTIDALIAAVPALHGVPLEAEQVAQVDSKDMDFAIWQALARRVDAHLSRPDVVGMVITHGTDTLEETAYFLHRVLAPTKPVVMTAAMRPATSLQADGPQNLLDAVTVARWPGARGVLAVLAGNVYTGADLRKTDSYRLDAFSPGEAGLLGRVEEGQLRSFRPWPLKQPLGLACMARDPAHWPRVEIVFNHVAADGRIVDALLAQGLDGLVVAGTGNGTVSHALEAAALRAQRAGVSVRRCSRCANGPVIDTSEAALPNAGALSPVQARIELLLQLLAASAD
ncbi:MAG: asparaginase [Pseudomonadota bacterium]|nr:asparaginase [Pseudomonadota bacterium]